MRSSNRVDEFIVRIYDEDSTLMEGVYSGNIVKSHQERFQLIVKTYYENRPRAPAEIMGTADNG